MTVIKTRKTCAFLLCLLVLGAGLVGCSTSKKTTAEASAPEAPQKVRYYLNSQIGQMSLDNAVLRWGAPVFFTQYGYTRVAVWRDAQDKFGFLDILSQADPTRISYKVSKKMGAREDTGWELRAHFNQNNIMTDWRYMEW